MNANIPLPATGNPYVDLALLGLTLAEQLIERAQQTEVSAEQQAALRGRLDSLRTKANGEFKGPEWEQSGKPHTAESRGEVPQGTGADGNRIA